VAAGLRGDAVDRIVRLCSAGLDPDALRREVLARLRRLMTVDAAFFATVDPATLLFTSAVADDPLQTVAPQFLANELGGGDVNTFAVLAEAPGHVGSLDEATHGERAASERFRDVMAPLGLGDELRAALVVDGWCWGVLCLHRERAAAGFAVRDAELLRRLGPHLARGLRGGLVSAPRQTGSPADGPGVLVVAPDGRVVSSTPEAQRWLSVLGPGRDGDLPMAVQGVAMAALRTPSSPRSRDVVVPTRDGGWVGVTASVLVGDGPPGAAVVLAPAPPQRVTSALLAGYGLTPAQQRVTELVLRGRSTRQIVQELHLSEYTVQEYLRGAFDRAGVNSRRELMASLMAR
jgi:DNA-binding CsgD family transcriptional regulator